MSREKLNKIHRLLSDWDNLSNKQRRAISGSAHDWKKKYEAGPNGVLYTIKDSSSDGSGRTQTKASATPTRDC